MNDIQSDDGVFRTLDLILAAYCKTIGYEILSIETEKNKGKGYRRSTICIDADDDLKTKVDEYWDGKATVNPLEFYNNVRALKSRITNECRGQ